MKRVSFGVPARLPARLTRLVAIGAVHRLVPARFERHEGFFSTPGASRRVHLPLRAVIAARRTSAIGATRVTTAGTPLCSAGGAPLGVLVATLGVVLLILRAEGEILAALGAGQGSVGRVHSFQFFCKSPSGRAGRSHERNQRTSGHRTVPTASSVPHQGLPVINEPGVVRQSPC
jgi:hypothetical protein